MHLEIRPSGQQGEGMVRQGKQGVITCIFKLSFALLRTFLLPPGLKADIWLGIRALEFGKHYENVF